MMESRIFSEKRRFVLVKSSCIGIPPSWNDYTTPRIQKIEKREENKMDQHELDEFKKGIEDTRKAIEDAREWNRKASRASWIAIIAASAALTVSILRLLSLIIPLLR